MEETTTSCPITGEATCACSDTGYTQPTTAAEEDAFVLAVTSEAECMSHMDSASTEAMEHMELLDLVPRTDATHIAVRDGDWSDPNTWYNGEIPGAGAKVLIPKGVTVEYDVVSDASIQTMRVDGTLDFATLQNTKLLIDTFVVADSGTLTIGTETDPMATNVTADIVFANNGDIDVTWDPTLLSRGLISHGQVEIHGAAKSSHLAVTTAPMAGDQTITLTDAPTGWQVGDTIVLTGTHKTGWTWDNDVRAVVHKESEDEEVVITAIDGATITIDRPLEYDHDTPRDGLSAYVANTTRNVTFSSEDGDATEVHHRGHVMFMHNDNVDVRYAAFDDLGRTDKSVDATDVSDLDVVTADSNIKGRYSFHFHRTGVDDVDNPALAIGNSVSGGPGWGFVHHSSNADFINNVAFDVFGAAFAAEDGDEIGLWDGNIAIKSVGIGYGDFRVKQAEDLPRHDNGRTGDGFFFAGRQVEASNNIAANTTNGYVWMSRSAPGSPLADNMDQPEIAYGSDTIDIEKTPLQGFHNNEAFGTHSGMIIVKANHQVPHDVRTVMEGFTAWEVAEGVSVSYSSHYTFVDFVIIGTENTADVASALTAIQFGDNTLDIVFNGLEIDGFTTGADVASAASPGFDNSVYEAHFIDAVFTNVGTDFENFVDGRHFILSSADLVEGRLEFDWTNDIVITEPAVKWTSLFTFDGVKTDSIGSRSRVYIEGVQGPSYEAILLLLQQDGYYELPDGTLVMLFEDYIADRATGELLKMTHVLRLGLSTSDLNVIGAPYMGVLDLSIEGPVTTDDVLSLVGGETAEINVLANDTDPDGDILVVDGLVQPKFGRATVAADGATIVYTPEYLFSGEDEFSYWARDPSGNFTKGTVTVTVTEPVGGWDVPVQTAASVQTPADPTAETTPSAGSASDASSTPTAQTVRVEIPDETTAIEAISTPIAVATSTFEGGDASDLFHGTSADESISGGAGDDQLYGHAGDDSIYAGLGIDLVRGGNGNDLIEGGDGDDMMLSGDFGDDIVFGGVGDDSMRGGIDNDTLFGQEGADNIIGDQGDDLLYGGVGNDTLNGAYGDDTVVGGDGDDSLTGGFGVDSVYGGNGDDYLFGAADSDTLNGEAGADTLFGGRGNDVFQIDPGNGADQIIDFRRGQDLIDLSTFAFTGIDDLEMTIVSRSMVSLSASATGEEIAVVSHGGAGDLAADDFIF